jgi:CHAT domain-containing protein/Tfp pilus assembly protein PilF
LPEEFPGYPELEAAFEEAFAHGDEARIAGLIRSNEGALFDAFDEYSQAWLEGASPAEPAPTEEIAKLEALALAVQTVFGSAVWLDMVGRLQSFDAGQRQRWLDARRSFAAGQWAKDVERCIERLSGMVRVFEELHWLPTLAPAEYHLGWRTCTVEGDFEQGSRYLERAAQHAAELGWPLLACEAGERRGWALTRLSRPAEADRVFGETLERAALVGRKRHLFTLRNIGLVLCDAGRHEAAMTHFRRRLEVEPGDEWEAHNSRLLRMACCLHLDERAEAFELLLQLCHRPDIDLVAALERGDREGVDLLLRAQGPDALHQFDAHAASLATGAYRRRRDDALLERARLLAERLAVVHHRPAYSSEVAALERMGAQEASDWLRGFALFLWGTTCYAEKRIAAGIECFKEARDLFDEAHSPARLAAVNQYLGSCHEAQAQHDRSVLPFAEAVRLCRLSGDEMGEMHALTCLGLAHVALGDYQQAITELTRTLSFMRESGEEARVAFTLCELASCYFALGMRKQAESALEEALELGRSDRRMVAKLSSQMGSLLCLDGKPESALPYLERATALQESGIGEPRDISITLSHLAICLNQLQRTSEATVAAQGALFHAGRVDSTILVANASNALGLSLAATGDTAGAISQHERALGLQAGLGQHRDAAWTQRELADCHLASGDPEQALIRLEACLAALNQVGRRVLPEAGRSSILAQWARVPGMTSAIVTELAGHDVRALERGFPIVDSFLARTLIEGLQERADEALLASSPDLVEARERALDEMMALRLQCAQERAPGELATLREELGRAETRYAGLEQQLRLANPALQQLMSPQPVSLRALQSAILADEEVLLQYVLGDQASFVWAITRDEARVVPIAPRAAIRAAYDRLAQALDPEGPKDASFLAPARELYELLLAPLARTLESRSRWTVVPDDFLAFVPFDALLTRDVETSTAGRDLPFVIRQTSVAYAPSASFLAWSPPSRREKERSKDILLVGDPTYPVEQVQDTALAMRPITSLRPDRVRRLEQTGEEVRAIARQLLSPEEGELGCALANLPRSGELSGARFDLLLGASATKTNLAAHLGLGGHRLLHFAVHGYVDTEYPWFSGLVLSGEQGEPCSFLGLVEIASLDLDADLVFLSACETARGEAVKSEGIKNAARAFFLAGARQVVATQWTVGDEASSVLAQRFYEELFRGASTADALRRAKLELLRARDLPSSDRARGIGETRPERAEGALLHPAFWAPYVLWGRAGR